MLLEVREDKVTTLEEIFIQCLGTPERLKEYIDTNTDLALYIKNRYGNLIKIARFLPNYKRLKEEAKTITWQSMLAVLGRRRPGLYKVILIHEKGLNWFKRQHVEKFIEVFEGG